jgi:N-acetylglucosamine-6-phosphate deacetylase
MQLKIINGQVITPKGIIKGGNVLIADGKIAEISTSNIDAPNASVINATGKYVSPGFIDIHVHGGGGHDFMDNTVDAFLGITQLHARHGTTSNHTEL